MTDTCQKCGRPKAIDIDDAFLGQDTCSDGVPGVDDPSCREIEVASAYQRGRRDAIGSLPSAEVLALLRGLVAERTGGVTVPYAPWCRVLDELDELEKAKERTQ
jgi:hypothetical protein